MTSTYDSSRSRSGQRRPVVAAHIETVLFLISLLPCDTVLLTILLPSQQGGISATSPYFNRYFEVR